MCYDSSRDESSVAVAEVPDFRPLPGEPRRRFKLDSLIYFVAANGSITYINENVPTDSEQPTGTYAKGDVLFGRHIADGRLVEIDRETLPAKPIDPRVDRLAAAEEDTGFKLGQSVQTYNGLNLQDAEVIGFARVDENGDTGLRRVVVRHVIPAQTVDQIFAPNSLYRTSSSQIPF